MDDMSFAWLLRVDGRGFSFDAAFDYSCARSATSSKLRNLCGPNACGDTETRAGSSIPSPMMKGYGKERTQVEFPRFLQLGIPMFANFA